MDKFNRTAIYHCPRMFQHYQDINFHSILTIWQSHEPSNLLAFFKWSYCVQCVPHPVWQTQLECSIKGWLTQKAGFEEWEREITLLPSLLYSPEGGNLVPAYHSADQGYQIRIESSFIQQKKVKLYFLIIWLCEIMVI